MNVVILKGRIARDAEYLGNSGKAAQTSLAVDSGSGDYKRTDFVSIKYLGERMAKFAVDYLKKGREIIVEGELNIDKNDKDGKYYTSIKVKATEFCGKKSDSTGQQDTQSAPAQTQQQTGQQMNLESFLEVSDGDMENLPFN